MTDLPALRGIHHLKFAVSDLRRSLDFYERAFGARRVAAAEHRTADGVLFAYILEIPGLGTKLELRLNPDHAERHRKFDPVTITVDDRAALERWAAHFDALDIDHSPVLTGIQAWVLVVDDPDGRRLRLYTLEMHGPDLVPDNGSPWLQT